MQKQIDEIRYYTCGYCTHNIGQLFKNKEAKIEKFYAGVFLIKHKKEGYILYDTGYSLEMYQPKFKMRLMNRLTPVFVKEEETIAQQLLKDGIKLEDIRWVILSHFHPDHIGGAKEFKEATFIVTRRALENYKKPAFTDMILGQLLPEDFEKRVKVIDPSEESPLFPHRLVTDLFEDDSLLATSVDGHAQGQLCLWLEEYQLFIGADAAWRIEFIEHVEKMTWLARFVQKNYTAYKEATSLLEKLLTSQKKVVVSHDDPQRIREQLK